jgi:GT2 family glycosyltransferase
VDLRVQGTLSATSREAVHSILDGMSGGGVVTEYGRNLLPVIPRVESVARAQGENYRWWAKLDDDAEVSKGAWDRLIACIHDAEEVSGHEVLCAMADPGGNRGPQFLAQEGGVLLTKRGPADMRGEVGKDHWSLCEFVGDGCTVFDLRKLEHVGYDQDFGIGGADIDLAMQAKLMGYKSLFCSPPHTEHRHKACSPPEYDALRYSPEEISRSSQVFRRKWGMPCNQLVLYERRAG